MALELKSAGDMAAATPNAEAFARNPRRVILPSLNILSSFSKVVMIFLLFAAKQPGSVQRPHVKSFALFQNCFSSNAPLKYLPDRYP
jgi:hypothetical protein